MKRCAVIIGCSVLKLGADWIDDELKNPSIKAFLDTIAYAEHTFGRSEYAAKFPRKSFDSFKDHPRTVECIDFKGQKLCSSAAGRYQFLTRTWDGLVPRISATDFGPRSQDRGALVLLSDKKALEDIKTNRFEKAIDRVRTLWASLPGSPYGQPTRTMHELWVFYIERLLHHQQPTYRFAQWFKG
jgi:muramidase (phage lysozyme)